MNIVRKAQSAPPPPENEPEQVPQEQPKRRRFIQPVFGKVVAISALLVTMSASAQTTPGSTGTEQKGTTMDAPPPARPTDRATDVPTQQNRAWQRFDDRTTTDLELDDAQRQRLRDIDERYDREYRTLGEDPMANPAYNDLYMRRDNEVRGVLSEDQYERWNRGNAATKPLRDNTGTAPAPTPQR
jgi:hypothetical protein